MSKKITHEQAREHLKDKIKDANINMVLSYITQQEKQEKLLELYRLYFKLRDKIYTISPHREDGDHYNYLLEKLSDVERQIKGLENERSN